MTIGSHLCPNYWNIMMNFLKQIICALLPVLFFVSITAKIGLCQTPPPEITRSVNEYHDLLQKRKDEIRRCEILDRQSREAMEAGDPEKALDLLKKAIAILRGASVRTASQTPEVTSTNDSPFGLHPATVIPPSEYGIANPYDFAVDLGAAWDRSLMFIWTLAQPDLSKNEFQWRQDRQMQDVPNSISLLANIHIGDPQQDSKYDQYAMSHSFLPRNGAAFTRFIKALVERYDGDGIDDMPGLRTPIKHWQVDNEPPHGLRDYAEFLKITYQAIKEADPEAKVLIGGVPGMSPVSTYLESFDKFYLPILDELARSGQRCFDIFDFHWYGNASGDYRDVRQVYRYIKHELDKRGLVPAHGYWITETGTYSGDPLPVPMLANYDYPFQTEEQQAADLFKRYVLSLSLGIKKVFHAFGLKEGFKYDRGFFDFTGLVHDGKLSHDRGRGIKKLAYYTYQLMTEKLQGIDWNSVVAIQDGQENIYAYKLVNKSTGKPVYAVWWDFFREQEYRKGDKKRWRLSADLDVADITRCLTDRSGTRTSWKTGSASGKIEVVLEESPLLIEHTN